MIITSKRIEKLRRARSLNDVLTLTKEIGKEVARASNISKILGTSARETSLSAVIKFNHSKMAGTPASKRVTVNGPKKVASMGKQLASFKAPSTKDILKHSAVIHGLQENLHELEASAAMIRTAFNRAKNQGAALKGITALVKEARKTLDDAYASLSFIANKHLPPEMSLMAEELRAFLIDNLDRKNYSNLSTMVYVAAGYDDEEPAGKLPHQTFAPTEKLTMEGPEGKERPKMAKIPKDLPVKAKAKKKETGTPTAKELKEDIVFSFYIDIEDLRDASGAVISHYYVILTGVIGKLGGIRYFLTALPEFRAPGAYNPGPEMDDVPSMIRRLSMLLASNDITSTLEKKPMPINTKDAAKRGIDKIENVERAYVADDSLWVVLDKSIKASNHKAIDKVVNQVFPLLNAAVGNARRTKSVIKYKEVQRAGKTLVQFFLTPNAKQPGSSSGTLPNAEQLADLQEQLGLEPKVMDDIKKVLKRHL